MKKYNIIIEATIESNLSPQQLKSQLVCALYNTDTWKGQFDWDSDNLRVIDYSRTEAF